jgi:hypothetical protein
MPIAIKENRPTKILQIIYPSTKRALSLIVPAFVLQIQFVRVTAYEFAQDTRGKPAPLYLPGSKIASFWDDRDVIAKPYELSSPSSDSEELLPAFAACDSYL